MSLREWFTDNFAAYPAKPLQLDLSPPPKPRLAAVTRAPSREEFAAWRDDPITQFVMAGYARAAEDQKESWLTESWDGGTADPATLLTYRVRADAYRAMEEASYEAFCELAGVEPEGE